LLTLAAAPAGTLTRASELAAATAIPQAFMYHITAQLARAGLVASSTGPAGGLVLARPPDEISLLDVMEVMDGPLCLNVCLARPQECPRDRTCPAHGVWGRVQAALSEQLRQATLAAMLAEGQQLQPPTTWHTTEVTFAPDDLVR
jgi:Rrf2 family protein